MMCLYFGFFQTLNLKDETGESLSQQIKPTVRCIPVIQVLLLLCKLLDLIST